MTNIRRLQSRLTAPLNNNYNGCTTLLGICFKTLNIKFLTELIQTKELKMQSEIKLKTIRDHLDFFRQNKF